MKKFYNKTMMKQKRRLLFKIENVFNIDIIF